MYTPPIGLTPSPKYWFDTRLGVQFPSYVAPVGILVAISIPIFTAQLEKAREATDLANIRSAYAEVMAAAITDSKKNEGNVTYDSGKYSATVQLKQQEEDWTTGITKIAEIILTGKPTKGGSCTVTYDTGNTTSPVTIELKAA